MSFSRGTRILFAALVTIIAMGAAVSTATASRGASVTNGVTLAFANGRLTLAAGGIQEICDVRLGLALNRTIAKTTLAPIGTILASPTSTIANCAVSLGGTVLPGITVGYIGFNGTLPNITGIRAQSNNAAFLLQFPGLSCLYTGTVPVVFNRSAAGAITSVAFNATRTLASAGAGCPTPGSLTGTLTVLATQPIVALI